MVERGFSLAIYCCVLVVIGFFLWLLADVFVQGIPRVSWQFLVTEPDSAGRAGGIAPILQSTLWILMVAMAVALPLGLGVAIWLAEYATNRPHWQRRIGVALDVLAGIPSIVYGLFGNAFFSVYLGLGFSLLAGGLTLACMVLPLFIRTCEVGLLAVPQDWRKGALALGMTRTAALWHILLPAALPTIAAGLILSIGRASAETAALVFTSGYVDRQPQSLLDSGRALAVHIFDLTMNVTGGDGNAYASAVVLILLIVLLNVLTQSLLNRRFVHGNFFRRGYLA